MDRKVVVRPNTEFELVCSHCLNNYTVKLGLSPGAILQSIELQAENIDIEFYCENCNKYFRYHKNHSLIPKSHLVFNLQNQSKKQTLRDT